jgi:hypothetical protein
LAPWAYAFSFSSLANKTSSKGAANGELHRKIWWVKRTTKLVVGAKPVYIAPPSYLV